MSVVLSPATSLAPYAPEVLMRILSFVKENDTFKDIVATSRQFYALGTDERARNMYWKHAEDVEPRLVQWANNPRRPRTQELNIRLMNYDHDFLVQKRIFRSLHTGIFPNLSSLTIRNGRITADIHNAVTHLPNLRQLRLQWCGIYAVERTWAPPAPPFSVTSLVLHEIQIFDRDSRQLDLLDTRTLMDRNLSLMPLTLLNGLTALTVSSDKSSSRVLWQAYSMLHDTPQLVDLSVVGPPWQYAHIDAPSPVLSLPALATFRGPHYIAASFMRSATHIAEVILTDEMSAAQPLIIVRALHPGAVRNMELTLERWDDDVACEIASRFTQCKRIKIVHRYWGPSDEWLFDFGVQRLPPTLNTLLIHARPQDAMQLEPIPGHYTNVHDYFARLKQGIDDENAGMRDVSPPPGEAHIRECFAAWKLYLPYLEVVALGGHSWTKNFSASVWNMEEEGSD